MGIWVFIFSFIFVADAETPLAVQTAECLRENYCSIDQLSSMVERTRSDAEASFNERVNRKRERKRTYCTIAQTGYETLCGDDAIAAIQAKITEAEKNLNDKVNKSEEELQAEAAANPNLDYAALVAELTAARDVIEVARGELEERKASCLNASNHIGQVCVPPRAIPASRAHQLGSAIGSGGFSVTQPEAPQGWMAQLTAAASGVAANITETLDEAQSATVIIDDVRRHDGNHEVVVGLNETSIIDAPEIVQIRNDVAQSYSTGSRSIDTNVTGANQRIAQIDQTINVLSTLIEQGSGTGGCTPSPFQECPPPTPVPLPTPRPNDIGKTQPGGNTGGQGQNAGGGSGQPQNSGSNAYTALDGPAYGGGSNSGGTNASSSVNAAGGGSSNNLLSSLSGLGGVPNISGKTTTGAFGGAYGSTNFNQAGNSGSRVGYNNGMSAGDNWNGGNNAAMGSQNMRGGVNPNGGGVNTRNGMQGSFNGANNGFNGMGGSSGGMMMNNSNGSSAQAGGSAAQQNRRAQNQKAGNKQVYSNKNENSGSSSGRIFAAQENKKIQQAKQQMRHAANGAVSDRSIFDPNKYEPSMEAQRRALARAAGRTLGHRGLASGTSWPSDIHRHKEGTHTDVFSHMMEKYKHTFAE